MKTLKQIKKPIFTSLLLLMLVLPSITNAQNLALGTCSKKGLIAFGFKKGSVYSLAPGIFEKFEAHYNRVDISVLKTGGRARTQVNIYLNNVYQGHLTFENGDYKRIQTYSLNNAKGKMVKVEIVNQSATNRFDYKLRLYHSQKRFLGKHTATLMPGKFTTNKGNSNHTLHSCTKKYKLTIKRKQGNAKIRIIVYYSKKPLTYNPLYTGNMNSNETTKTIKVTVPEDSNGGQLYYTITNTDENNFVKVEVIGEVGKFKSSKKKSKGKKLKKVIHRTNH